MPPAIALPIFIGTSSNAKDLNRGIYFTQLDPVTGALTAPVLAAETPNPGFLALHPGARVLYSSGECGRIDEKAAAGAVNAYACEPATGRLSALGQQPTGGLSVTHLMVDTAGRMLFTASYHGGQIAGFPLEAGGKIAPRTASIHPVGTLGPNRARQEKPHPHCVMLAPDERYLISCDLGLDRIFCFRVDAVAVALMPAEPPFAGATPGVGPRHCKFSAGRKSLHVINELGSSITTYSWEASSGALSPRETVSTLPAGFNGENICAEIQVHPNGRFVYGSNRGHDSIAVFGVDAGTGRLNLVEITSCGGKHPRHFSLSPDGEWLVCANRDTHNLTVFRVDFKSGRLSAATHVASVPSPTCILFAPVR